MGCDVIKSTVEKGQWMLTMSKQNNIPLPDFIYKPKRTWKVHSQEMSITTQKQTMTLSGSYSSTLKPKPNRSVYCIFRVRYYKMCSWVPLDNHGNARKELAKKSKLRHWG